MKTQIFNSKLSIEERETFFHISYDDDKTVYMDTTILKDYNRALKQGWELIEQFKYGDGSVLGGRFIAPRRCLTMRNVKKKKLNNNQMNNLNGTDDE